MSVVGPASKKKRRGPPDSRLQRRDSLYPTQIPTSSPFAPSRIDHIEKTPFLSSRSRHTSSKRDWSSDVCSSDLPAAAAGIHVALRARQPAPPPARLES